MKVRFSENIINLRAENEAEKQLLDEMWDHGVVAFGGGAELGICSKKYFGSGSVQQSTPDKTASVTIVEVKKEIFVENQLGKDVAVSLIDENERMVLRLNYSEKVQDPERSKT